MEETGETGPPRRLPFHPDYAVAVDVTFGTQPDVSRTRGFALGRRPCHRRGPQHGPVVHRRFQQVAKDQNIDTQLEIMSGNSGTNGWDIQIAREGVATQVLSIPLRYMHTPYGGRRPPGH